MWNIPLGEKQRYAFDTNACGIFAVLNAIESYKIDGLENLSDRYTSINIGGLRGNLPTEVVKSINEYGLLKEELLPFGGNNQIEYYNKNVITPSMISEAKKVLDRIEIKAEYVNFGLGKEIAVKEALKISPLVGVFLNNDGTTHAMMIPNYEQVLDSYEPFIKRLDISRLHYAVKIIVKVKPMNTWKYFKPTETTGSNRHTVSELDIKLVNKLDKMRGECGFPFIITSGYRTKEENANLKDSVVESAHCERIAADIKCNDSTKRMKIISSALLNGINRVGISDNFIHLDISTNKPQGVCWLY